MIAYAMLYTVAVGVPVLAAAWALAAVLRRYGRAERWVWLTGLGLAFALPVLGLLQGQGASGSDAATGSAAGASTGVIGLPEILVVPEGTGDAGMVEVLVGLWVAASLVLAARLAVAAIRLARVGRSWTADTMDGAPVWLTEEVGPAVAGLLRPRVLVPTWLAELPAHQRSLVLLHEQEHIRAGDPWLMLLSRVAPVLTPWNPVVWLLSARLLRAIELDCDRRVLRSRPDVRTYGWTLIEISSRDRGRLVAAAAFAESEAPLRSRILNMTTPSRTVSVVALLTSMVFGVVLMVAAFEIPVPTLRAEISFGPEPTGSEVAAPSTDDADKPGDRADADGAERRLESENRQAIRRTESPPDAAEVIAGVRAEAATRLEAARLEAERAARATEESDARVRAEQQARATEELAIRTGRSGADELSRRPTFTPFTVAPRLLNLTEVQQALTREYPTLVRDAGIGGTVLVWFFIDADGVVRQSLVDQSSGYPVLDEAALNVADVYRFSPALNRDERVPVWVALPITFQPR